jgi:hypothetical protein
MRLGGLREREAGADLDGEPPRGQETERHGNRLGAPPLLLLRERMGRTARERPDAESARIRPRTRVAIRCLSATSSSDVSMASSVPAASRAAVTPSGAAARTRPVSPSPYSTGVAPEGTDSVGAACRGRRDDRRTPQDGVLDRGLADRTGSRVDEDGVARADAQRTEGLVGPCPRGSPEQRPAARSPRLDAGRRGMPSRRRPRRRTPPHRRTRPRRPDAVRPRLHRPR